MKTRTIAGILIVGLVALSAGLAAAQYGQGYGDSTRYVDSNGDVVCYNNCVRGCGGSGMNFVDEDGNGVCDYFGINGRDDDKDGIPNGQDEDYVPLRDGSGNGGKGKRCTR